MKLNSQNTRTLASPSGQDYRDHYGCAVAGEDTPFHARLNVRNRLPNSAHVPRYFGEQSANIGKTGLLPIRLTTLGPEIHRQYVFFLIAPPVATSSRSVRLRLASLSKLCRADRLGRRK